MKQTMKRTISLLLALVMSLSVFAGLRLPAFALDDEVLEIRTVDDWNRFSVSGTLYNVESGFYRGKTVRLLADVGPVTTTFGETFLGTFDGGGHTLTVNSGNGLFEAIAGGGVKNLTVAGAVSLQDTGALVETVIMNSNCVISNVRITADVSSPGGAVAGFVGWCEEYSSLVIENSAFEGGLFGNTAAGFVNYCSGSSVTIKNSVFCGYCENAKNFSTVGYTDDESPSSATIQNVKTNTPDVYGGLEWWRTPLYNTALPTDAGYSPAAAQSLINRIGDVAYTAECKAKIDKARAVYDTLTAEEKQQVTNFNTLQAAEAAFAAFNTGKALQLTSAGAAANIEGAQASSVYFGNYMQSSADSKEPVKWRVLSNAAGRLFLLSDQNLDVVRYNEESTSVTWATCTLRKWLNGYDGNPYSDSFIGSAFSGKETAAIAETAVVNDDNPTYGTDGGENTTDRVFLLSIAEAKTTAYGFTDNVDDTNTRKAVDTGYARSGGHTGYTANRYNWWWLRSPGYRADSSSIVSGAGYLSFYGDRVSDSDAAVRPAFNLNLNAVLFTSAAVDGKVGDGALTEIAAYTGSDWKLTLPDESRAFTVAETAANVTPGDTVTLTYTGATVGTNEYISAILADETGAAVYYGRLSQPDAANGTLTVTVPADLASGSYTLKVFSEQYNGEKKTDFASAFCDVTLSVTSLLDIDKAAAKAELDTYKDPADYRADEQAALAAAISAGKDAIDAAADSAAVATALTAAKTVIDAIKTDAELTAEELAAAKTAAKEELAAYKNADDYRAAEQAALAEAIAAGAAAIDAAADADGIAAALANAKAALDTIKTDAELTAEELAAAKTAAKEELAAYKNADDYRADEQAALAEAIASANAAVDAAADADAVAAALEAAKAALDAIKTDAQLTAEEAAAAQAAADPAAFNAYKAGLKTVIDRFANEDDNAECAALIAQAKADLDALAYDETKTLDENINAATALVDQLAAALDAVRHPADPGDPAVHTPAVEVSPSIIITLFRVLMCFFRDVARDLTELASHFSR